MAMYEQIMRSWRVSNLAREQALLVAANETPMDAKLLLEQNRASLPGKSESRRFKHDFRRHMRNTVEGNPFSPVRGGRQHGQNEQRPHFGWTANGAKRC